MAEYIEEGIVVAGIHINERNEKQYNRKCIIVKYDINKLTGNVNSTFKTVKMTDLVDVMKRGMKVDNFRYDIATNSFICTRGAYENYIYLVEKNKEHELDDINIYLYVIGMSARNNVVYLLDNYNYNYNDSCTCAVRAINVREFIKHIADTSSRFLNFCKDADSMDGTGIHVYGGMKIFDLEEGKVDIDGMKGSEGTKFITGITEVMRTAKMGGNSLNASDIKEIMSGMLEDCNFDFERDVIKCMGECKNKLRIAGKELEELRENIEKVADKNGGYNSQESAIILAVAYALPDARVEKVGFMEEGIHKYSLPVVYGYRALVNGNKGSYIVNYSTGIIEKCIDLYKTALFGKFIDNIGNEGDKIERDINNGISIVKQDGSIQVVSLAYDDNDSREKYNMRRVVEWIIPLNNSICIDSSLKKLYKVTCGVITLYGEANFHYTETPNEAIVDLRSIKECCNNVAYAMKNKARDLMYYASKLAGGFFADGGRVLDVNDILSFALESAKKKIRAMKKSTENNNVCVVKPFQITENNKENSLYGWVELYAMLDEKKFLHFMDRCNKQYEDGVLMINKIGCYVLSCQDEIMNKLDEGYLNKIANKVTASCICDVGMDIIPFTSTIGICGEKLGSIFSLDSGESLCNSKMYRESVNCKDGIIFGYSKAVNENILTNFVRDNYSRTELENSNMAFICSALNIACVFGEKNFNSNRCEYNSGYVLDGNYITRVYNSKMFVSVFKMKNSYLYHYIAKMINMDKYRDIFEEVISKYKKLCIEHIGKGTECKVYTENFIEYVLYSSLSL